MVSMNRNPAQGFYYPEPVNMYPGLPGINSMPPPANPTPSATAAASTTSLGVPPSKRIRKTYTITKTRQSWTEQEHEKFIEGVQLFDRDWKKIEAFIGSKTAIQIRSHAQKYFEKVLKSGKSERVPPPRPKKKAAHPYPHKAPNNAPNVVHVTAAPNVTHVTRAPTVTHMTGAPTVNHMTRAPTASHMTRVPSVTHLTGASNVTHVARAPIVTHITGAPNVTNVVGPFHSSAALLESAYYRPDSSSMLVNPIAAAPLAPWRCSFVPPINLAQLERDDGRLFVPAYTNNSGYSSEINDPRIYSQAMRDNGASFLPAVANNSLCDITESSTSTVPSSEINNPEVYYSQGMTVGPTPDLPQLYKFMANVFDPNATDHLQRLRQMNPTNFKAALRMMNNLSDNLRTPALQQLCSLLSSSELNEEKVTPPACPNKFPFRSENAILST